VLESPPGKPLERINSTVQTTPPSNLNLNLTPTPQINDLTAATGPVEPLKAPDSPAIQGRSFRSPWKGFSLPTVNKNVVSSNNQISSLKNMFDQFVNNRALLAQNKSNSQANNTVQNHSNVANNNLSQNFSPLSNPILPARNQSGQAVGHPESLPNPSQPVNPVQNTSQPVNPVPIPSQLVHTKNTSQLVSPGQKPSQPIDPVPIPSQPVNPVPIPSQPVDTTNTFQLVSPGQKPSQPIDPVPIPSQPVNPVPIPSQPVDTSNTFQLVSPVQNPSQSIDPVPITSQPADTTNTSQLANPSSWYVGYGPSPISKAAEAASVKGGKVHVRH
jgi:hypothetical protein